MRPSPPSTSGPPGQLALERVTRQLEKVTDELIRLLFAQAREPSPTRDARIAELEAKRDELHDRLTTLESWTTPSERSQRPSDPPPFALAG